MQPPPVRPIQLSEIRAARERIAPTIVRTPLVRLELGPDFPEVHLKLENLQPINAYKLRGAANAVAMLSEAERTRGVWTISAGNAGQGVAYAARQAGVPSTVVAIETAPAAKLERMRALGAKLVLVPYQTAWKTLDDSRLSRGRRELSSTRSMTTISLPAMERWDSKFSKTCPRPAPSSPRIGGGGLIAGVGSAIKALRPRDQSHRGRTGDRRTHCRFRSPRAHRRISRSGKRPSSTARAARAFSRECGSE